MVADVEKPYFITENGQQVLKAKKLKLVGGIPHKLSTIEMLEVIGRCCRNCSFLTIDDVSG